MSRIHVNPPVSFISRAPLRNAPSASRDSAPPTLMRLAPTSASCASVIDGSAVPINTLTGLLTDFTTVRMVGEVAQARCVEHVGAGFLERLQTLDGVVEIDAAVEKVLGSRRQCEREGQRSGRLDRRVHALNRELEVVDRLVRIAARVFDRAAYNARLTAASRIISAAACG